MTGKVLKGWSDFPSVFWNPVTTVQKPQKIRILLAQNSQSSEELRSQTHRAWQSPDAHEPCVRGCSQAELGRCPAASAAFALLSKGTQEANQVHLVFTDSLSTHTDRISALSSLRYLAAAPPRHFHQQKKQHWRKQVSFCQESALSWLIEKSNPSFKSTGKKKLFLFVLSGNTTELMLWLQPSFAVPNFGEANEAHKRATQNCSTSASINNVYTSAQISGIRKKNYKDLIMAMQQPSSTNSTWSVLLPPILITCSRN